MNKTRIKTRTKNELNNVTSTHHGPTRLPRVSSSAPACCLSVSSGDDVRPLAMFGFKDAKIRFRWPIRVMSSNYSGTTVTSHTSNTWKCQSFQFKFRQ